MSEIAGIFGWNGKPQNGAVAKLWKGTAFEYSPFPGLDDDEPDAGYQQGSAITTGVEYGSDGAFRFTAIPAGRWWVSVEFDGHRAWFYFNEPIINSILTTQGDTLFRGASELERRAIGSEGQIYRVQGGVPTWG